MRKWMAICCISLMFGFVAILFWYNEWRYNLPTPVPEKYQPVKISDYVDLPGKLKLFTNAPLFLHFFNPDCPCSRFNIPTFKSLATEYAANINFVLVVMTKDKSYTEEKIREKYGLTVPVLFDTSLARICGVYSTPQAVLLDKNHSLYYRGNYNRSRYCTDKKSSYARIAIDSLLTKSPQPVFNAYALKAYGCSLPGCQN